MKPPEGVGEHSWGRASAASTLEGGEKIIRKQWAVRLKIVGFRGEGKCARQEGIIGNRA